MVIKMCLARFQLLTSSFPRRQVPPHPAKQRRLVYSLVGEKFSRKAVLLPGLLLVRLVHLLETVGFLMSPHLKRKRSLRVTGNGRKRAASQQVPRQLIWW